MSKIFSYNKKTTGEGWVSLNSQYNADEIDMIADPNGGLSQKPRTAIPSPFAQMDLVKNAFKRLSMHRSLQGEAMDEKLVANALDVAQLFFNYSELKNHLQLVEWNRDVELEKLKSQPEHKLLGETIEMFLEQDKEAFNFDRMDRVYFLFYGNKVVGSTSPVSVFMASPNAEQGNITIPVEQNVNLFDLWRPLHVRNEKFILYIYALFSAYPQLKKLCGEVNSYLITSFELLNPELQKSILENIGNPSTMDLDQVDKAMAFLQSSFVKMEDGVQVLGCPLYQARQEDVMQEIAQSDFMVEPSNEVEDEQLPLILQNHLNATASNPFKYVSANWNDTIEIKPEDYAVEPGKRTLPATNHQYPWLTDDDFLQSALIKLDYPMDGSCFFDGNMTTETKEVDDCHFVLPIKPLYFKYFKVSDLWETIGGLPRFEMRRSKAGQTESVTVILRIPIKKAGHFITLKRTYLTAHNIDLSFDTKTNRGAFITVPFALSIFPFVRVPGTNRYNVQLVDRALGMLENYRLSISFYHNGFGNKLGEDEVTVRERSRKVEKRVGSQYYKVTSDFDYIGVQLLNDRGGLAAEGMICPKWAEYAAGHSQFTFAVDFGTTNTHVECMCDGLMPEPLRISDKASERLLATLYHGENLLYDVIIKQEFVTKEIGNGYGFPQRTVLSESDRLDVENVDAIVALGDANIPFIYEKESVGYGNRIVPNLKWSTEVSNGKRIKAYLTELALLMRTKVLLEHGDIAKTRMVWFYPLSMKLGNIRKLEEAWARTVREVFEIETTSVNLIQMPESVAPYYFYKASSHFRGAASTVAGIDIGGGSSDVIVFEPGGQYPVILTSFRYAGNVLFGDGFSEIPHGDSNPMLRKYVDYFKRLFDADDDKYGELNGILDDITSKRKSEDINAFLFSVINNKVVGANEVFSYNQRLNEDPTFKIVFIYFYAALIYYVAKMMKHRGLGMPRSVMFSGTGSKVLDIIGGQRDIDLLSQSIFENVYQQKYDVDGFSVIMERKEPKEITCRGALLQVRDEVGNESVSQLNQLLDSFDSAVKYNYSMISKETLVYADMDRTSVRSEIVAEVKNFNDFFIALCDEMHVSDRFLVDRSTFNVFIEYVNKDLEHHLANGWNFVNKNDVGRDDDELIEDALFFYPIIGSIRDNLIEHLH